MVKTVNTLTVGQYGLYQKTGKEKYLMTIPLPFLFKQKIQDLIKEVNKGLQGGDIVESAMRKETHRLKSIRKLQYLMVLYQGVYNGMVNTARLESMSGKSVKSKALDICLEKVRERTQIDIKSPEDLKKLSEKINHMTDKYTENFNEPEEVKGMTYNQVLMTVFILSGLTAINYNMRMSDFFELKEQAEEISKRAKKGN